MSVVDFHAYVGNWPYWSVPHADETGHGLLGLMDRFGVEMALVTSLKSVFYDVAEGNEIVFQLADQYHDRLIPAPVVNPRAEPNVRFAVTRLIERGAKAIYLFPFYHGYRLRSDWAPLGETLRAACALGCPVVIPLRLLMNWGFPTINVESVLKLAKEFGEGKFVVAGFNYGEFTDVVEGCKSSENIWLETSGLTMMRGVELLVEQLGPSRIVCGTAMPLQYPGCGLIKVREAFLPDEQKEMIFNRNAVKLLAGVGQ